MQAEHIPVHLGSMPDAVAARARRGAAPRRPLDPQRPLPRRHPPARHHADLARLRRDGELLGFAASRAHHADVGGADRRPGCRRDSTRLDEEGVVIPPTRVGDGELERLARPDAQPAPAARRPARAARREPGRRAAPARAGRAATAPELLRAGMAEILDYAERRTRAALAELAGRRLRGRGRARGRRRGPERDVTLRVTATDRGRRPEARLRRHRRPGRRATSTARSPVTKSAAFFAVRVLTDPDAPPSAGAHRADRGRSRPRAAC